MKITAIIVSFNVKHYLVQCIMSLFKSYPDIEIIVVDNDSHDGTQSYLQEVLDGQQQEQLIFIANKENVGFGKANNQALEQAHGDYILFINPDTFVGEDTIQTCLDFISTHPEAGIIGSRMLNINGSFAKESRRAVPLPLTSFYKLCGLTALFPNSPIFGKYYMQYLDESKICKIDVVSGAFMMTSKKLLEKYGAFDEEFFMYGEDIELSYRFSKYGYQNYYLPTRILHYKGESTNKASRKYINDFYMAMLIFFRKYHPKAKLLYLIIYISVYLFSFKALLMQWIVKIKNKLHLAQNNKAQYIFCGSEKMIELSKKISSQASLDSLFYITDPSSVYEKLKIISKKTNPTYIVFDMDIFSYTNILEIFDTTEKTNFMIGTLYPKLGTMITNENTFTLNS